MADGEQEVVEQFHGILACGTLGGRLIKGQDVLQQLKVRFASAFDSGSLH